MARTGLYKSDVKKARDSLLAQSQYPSVDAVRVALGNTGSKTTIHKYLKELEEEEGAGARKATISDALQDLVERLASRLQEEADQRVAETLEALALREQEFLQTKRQLEQALHAARESSAALESRLHAEAAAHAQTRDKHQAETVARHTAEQQVADLKDRLAENEQHRNSLEEKHIHARNALEHYRQSVKDQRDQDQRRHEQQVQQVQAELRQQQLAAAAKQGEVTKLNQEAAKLLSELAHTKQSLYEQLTHGRKLEQKVEQLQSLQVHASNIERQLAGKMAEVELLSEQLAQANTQLEPARARARELEILLAEAQARAEAQQQIGDQLRGYLDKFAQLEREDPQPRKRTK
ncbi:DNA-binding protein [Duganella callida]|uniref:DNA-binding protein n=1 Tax=Duganella callida TaxID=2561932 RepID=A0A4Y9SHX7_9BURK|nr:DNA-binding protein [Duganella callida]TFW20099.1 DNA-binding protein [Duganella callida]